ncbi:aryl-alcohol oxidase-like protein [Amanita rubescens]|nr:aryl-alcohol oxidase-like protein [Amanita rubescens]
MRVHINSLFLALYMILARTSYAAIYTNPLDVTSKSYDFIVVGAGTAGGVVATRLTENSSVNVLVIEAGLSDEGYDNSYLLHIPFFAGGGVGTRFDWNYTVVNQPGLNNRNFEFPRGYVIGGSSAINNEVYFRGTSEDFDYFANVSGDSGWSWSNMQHYISIDEQHVAAWNNQNDVGKYNPAVHGTGPLLTSLPTNNSQLDFTVINTTQKLGNQFPFNLDLNSGNGLGVGWVQTTVGNSARSDGSTAFLTPAATTRSNLDVLLQTQVISLVQTAHATFRGVNISQGPNSPTYTLHAANEVILSAGTVGTPQILQLSGIGSKTRLQSLGITSVLNLPGVGQNLQDQPVAMFQFAVNGNTMNPFLNDPSQIQAAFAQYETDMTGTLASSCLINTIGFLRIPSSDSIWKSFPDPAIGPNSPHYVLGFVNAFSPNPGQTPPTTGQWITAALLLQAITSSGSVNIVSNSPWTYPAINPAYLSTASDIAFYTESVKSMQKFLNASTWNGFLGQPYPDAANLTTNVAIGSYLRRFSNTIKHPVGTASVGSSTYSMSVVGPNLLVKQATGLRIVDASVIPRAVTGFPSARVYLIAERASALIKAQYGL